MRLRIWLKTAAQNARTRSEQLIFKAILSVSRSGASAIHIGSSNSTPKNPAR
jgi:hypothetical protein